MARETATQGIRARYVRVEAKNGARRLIPTRMPLANGPTAPPKRVALLRMP